MKEMLKIFNKNKEPRKLLKSFRVRVFNIIPQLASIHYNKQLFPA